MGLFFHVNFSIIRILTKHRGKYNILVTDNKIGITSSLQDQSNRGGLWIPGDNGSSKHDHRQQYVGE